MRAILGVIGVMLGFVGFLGLVASMVTTNCTEESVIAEVGGCDRNGECGVRYNDGSFGWDFRPVPGKTVCTRKVTHLHGPRWPGPE